MRAYDHITVIYNPKSTGNSAELARLFVKKAKQIFPEAATTLVPTKYMAHAEEIAEAAVKKKGRILIVSSSGDGGYNEVVNGVMKSKKPLQNITCAVLAAGNANDHSRTMHDQPLAEKLDKAKPIRIDLLKVTVKDSSQTRIRYAHSYIGIGFTPQVALELNKHRLNPIRESLLVLKTFRRFKPFKIKHMGRVRTIDNLVFSNINQMAKVLTLADKNRPRDGRFEVIVIRHRGKFWLFYKLLVAMVSWIRPQRRATRYSFIALQAMPMQLDGEVIKLKKDSKVSVTIAPRALRTLI
jgi:diacylglycerol kinase (ATP)